MSLSSSLVTPNSAVEAPDRAVAISSTSSMNNTNSSSSASSAKASRSEAASPPVPVAANLDGNNSTNGQPSRDAIALAKLVLPVPGGPNRITALGGRTP